MLISNFTLAYFTEGQAILKFVPKKPMETNTLKLGAGGSGERKYKMEDTVSNSH